MKKLLVLLFAVGLLAVVGCEKKADDTTSKGDGEMPTLTTIEVAPEAKKEAAAQISEANVEAEADKLLKEIESDTE